jgi:hypothetical protein
MGVGVRAAPEAGLSFCVLPRAKLHGSKMHAFQMPYEECTAFHSGNRTLILHGAEMHGIS